MTAKYGIFALAWVVICSTLGTAQEPRLGILVVQNDRGVVVSSVARGTLATVMNFSEGDRIVGMNNARVTRPNDLNDLLAVRPGMYTIELVTRDGQPKRIEGEIRKSSKDGQRNFFVPKK
jgi:S1-C subfamily serine protease